MKLLSMALALTLALSGPASFAGSCEQILLTCEELAKSSEKIADAYETAIAEYKLKMQAQDGVIGNLREQRDLALEGSGGGIFTDYLIPVLIGAALTTVVIGIRR